MMNSKIIKGSIKALLLLPVLIFAKDTLQVEIKKSDTWQLIGVNGIHSENGSSSTAGSTWSAVSGVSSGEIKDVVDSDGNTTWYNFSASTAVLTTDDNASLGVLIIGGEILPNGNAASTTTPDNVYIKGSFKTFDPTSPKSTMYLKSTSSSNPIVKLTYQSNMEGTNIYIKFDNIDDANYYTNIKLDSTKTFDNALILAGYEYNNTTTATTDANLTAKILDIYDENLSDNNRSLFPSDQFKIADEVKNKYNDTNITLFKYDSSSWKLYDSRNSNGNDFDSFEVGKGYWAKIQKSKNDPSGFIFATGDIGDTTWTSVFGNLINGWNLLSFNDDVLRYSPTGVFIKIDDINTSGLKITDAYGSYSFDLISAACDTEKNASAYINFKVMQADQNGSANFKLRAYPVQKYDGSVSGIVILSSQRFEVNISTATTLAGDNLKIDPINNRYYPKYGEYILGVVPNSAIYGLNAPIKATIQGYSNGTVSSVDLSTVNKITDVATKINDSLASIKDINASAYLIDTNWDDKNETILMAVDKKFGIKESSYYKLFKQVDSGPNIYVEGNITGLSAPTASVNSTFTTTVSNINNLYNTNGVKAYATKQSENIMILISTNRDVDIKEGNSKNVITDLPIPYNDGNDTQKGAFTKVYDSSDLINLSVKYDNNDTYDYSRSIGQQKQAPTYLIENLGLQTVWLRDFPSGVGAIQKMAKLSNKRVKLIFTAARTPNGVRWLSLDATKSPAVWYDVNDTQTLMWTEKERGYWVYLEDYTAPTITQTAGAPTSTVVTTHFDNNVSSSGTSTTYNYVRKDIPVTVSGIDPKYQDSEFTYASIGGSSYSLINNGSSRILSIDSYAMYISQSTSDTSIDLFTYDGVGGEAKTTSITTVGVVQPLAPQLSWDTTTGDLTIANTDFASWQIHEGNISDIDINASLKTSVTASNFNLASLGLDPNWNNITDSTPYFEMKVVTVGDNGFYSDIQAFKYAPVHEGTHVLSSSSSTTYDEAPGTYITSTTAPTLIADSGVGLKSLTGSTVTMAYQPLTNDNEYVRLNNNLPKVMFVQDLNNNPIATIKFVDDYTGKKFYIYDTNSKSLFYGKFLTGYDNDSQRYTLTKVDNYGNDGQIIIKP